MGQSVFASVKDMLAGNGDVERAPAEETYEENTPDFNGNI